MQVLALPMDGKVLLLYMQMWEKKASSTKLQVCLLNFIGFASRVYPEECAGMQMLVLRRGSLASPAKY